MKLIYNNKNLELRFGVREMLLFQEVTKGRVFQGESLTDCFYLFWIMVQVAYGKAIQWEEFSHFVDDNPQIFSDYMEWLVTIFQTKENTQKN
jgi:hypothetical protein